MKIEFRAGYLIAWAKGDKALFIDFLGIEAEASEFF
jgi:hypothetical protein